MATLGSTFAIAAFSLSGGKKADGPPIGAGSKEEESFVK
jgi:F-type H+-transporting ATPase subunit k